MLSDSEHIIMELGLYLDFDINLFLIHELVTFI